MSSVTLQSPQTPDSARPPDDIFTSDISIHEAPASLDPAPAAPPARPRHLHLWALLAITVAGGFVRFATIAHPAIWGDEAATYWRVCGSYQKLLDILQTDGFAPLHYEFYWLLYQLPLHDAAIRIMLTLLIGVLTFSATYLFARKVTGPPAAMILAAITGAGLCLATGYRLTHAPMPPALAHWGWLICGLMLLPTAYMLARAILRPAAAIVAALISGLSLVIIVYALMRVTQLTPPVLRFFPALAGTLMIPAMYFLASHIVGRKTSLLVALFTACSAYMMVYSHDAKMYMQMWLFGVLSAGCLLWWMRSRRRLAWLAWIASSLACVGIHSPGWLVLAIQPLFLLTQPHPRWKQLPLFLIGFTIIGAGSIGHYLGFNRWAERVDEHGWGSSGISWVDEYDVGRTGSDLLLFTATAHLYSWEWPGQRIFGPTPPWVFKGMRTTAVVLLLLFALGALPWTRRIHRAMNPRRFSRQLLGRSSANGPHAGKPSASCRLDAPPQPWWRATLWLGIWLIIPAYGFYCWSVPHFVSPFTWIQSIGDLFHEPYPLDTWVSWAGHWRHWQLSIWWILAVECIAVAGASMIWPPVARFLAAALGIFAAGAFVIVYVNTGLSFGFVAGEKWLDLMTEPQVLGIILGVLPGICWYYAGPTFRVRMLRSAQFAGVAAAIFFGCVVVYHAWFDLGYQDQVTKMIADHQEIGGWNGDVDRMRSTHGVPSRAQALQKIEAASPNVDPGVLARRADAEVAAAQDRWIHLVDRARKEQAGVAQSEAERLAAERLAAEQLVWQRHWNTKWMPRYVGALWPALAIAACALLLRLPTFPLRWLAVIFFIGVNVTQSYARLYAGTEPPWDKIALDVRDAQSELAGKPTHTTSRTYLLHLQNQLGGHPGSLEIDSGNAHYYFALINNGRPTPDEFRGYLSEENFHRIFKINLREVNSPRQIADEIRRSPDIHRIVVWEAYPPSDEHAIDRLQPLLGAGWKLQSEQTYVGRMHWMWQELDICYRRVYQQVAPPPTAPKPSPPRPVPPPKKP